MSIKKRVPVVESRKKKTLVWEEGGYDAEEEDEDEDEEDEDEATAVGSDLTGSFLARNKDSDIF